MHQVRSTFLLAAFAMATWTNLVAATFTVGPDESYTTISSALAKMGSGDVCVIRPGVYRERIEVGLSGVTLRGEGRVVITGCDVADALQAVDVNGQQAMKQAISGPVYDVVQDGRALVQARFPDKTAPMTSNRDWAETEVRQDGRVVFLGRKNLATFADLADGIYVGMHGGDSGGGKLSSWYSVSAPITGVDDDGLLLVDTQNDSPGYLGDKHGWGKGVGYIIGARAALDAPGEWHATDTELTVIPRPGSRGPVEMRTRLYGAVITGDKVRLENIRFVAATARVDGAHATFDRCAFSLISPFWHGSEPDVKGTQSLASCWGVPEHGTAGIYVTGDHFTARHCRIKGSWWAGMTVRGDRALIEHCLVEDINWIARRGAGICSWGDGNVIRHCTFRKLGACAIEGGNGGWMKQYATNNIWEHNLIEDACCLGVDQGFFYVNHKDGSKPPANSTWRYNVGRRVHGPEKGDWKRTAAGYYIDNSSSGYRVHHNIAIDASEAIRYNDNRNVPHAGKDIWYYNNTFYRCDAIAIGCWTQTKGERKKLDAEVMLINNLSIGSASLKFSPWEDALGWKNNLVDQPATVVRDAAAMDFTPVAEQVRTGGRPVQGEAVSYIGAVDPAKGMWSYGADEAKLPVE